MQGSWTEALAAYRQAIGLAPDVAIFHYNLGAAAEMAGHWNEAMAAHQRAVELNPDDAMMLNHLGMAQIHSGLPSEGIASIRRAVSLRPDDPLMHWSLSTALLSVGYWEEGWREYEWRLAAHNGKLDSRFQQPKWDGSPIPGKTLLLHVEGGYGDALQFVRFVPLSVASGATLILECQAGLFELFKQVPGVSKLIARGEALPPFDVQIPLLSLPWVFGTTERTIPARSPYLVAPVDRVEKFLRKLSRFTGLKVGLVWAGQARRDEARTRTLDIFSPLAAIPGVTFFSVQKGAETAQKPPAGMNLIDLTADIADFADAAGLLANLDLLISVDTAAAHLAGAMGKAVWTLIPFWIDYRWLLDREDSPWYPSMRLFRQTYGNNWQNPIERIAGELRKLVTERESA
jgi:hypothetical protein